MSKRSQLHFRGPLQAHMNVQAFGPLGWTATAPKPLKVWLCTKTVNSTRLDVGQLTWFSELKDLVELDPADVTISPPSADGAQVYVDAEEWLRLGGRRGPDVAGERASERAMRLSAGKVSKS